MRSLADRWRLTAEHGLHASSIGVLLWMLLWSLRPVRSEEAPVRIGAPGTLRDSLPVWSASAFSDSIHLEMDTVPDFETRDWLVALRRNGASVAWSGPHLSGTAVTISPVGSPAGGVSINVAAPAGSRVEVSDALGVVDTVTASGGGVSLRFKGVAPPVSALVRGQFARAAEIDSLTPRRVAVIGGARWESKFLIAALEEGGWTVDAVLSVAPGVDVTQGDVASIDTAYHAAVIMLDSSATRFGNRVARFVRQGGGAILAGGGPRVAALEPLTAGKPGPRIRPRTIVFPSDSPRRALGFQAISNLRADAVIVEKQDERIAVAARRVGSGRVVQVGYEESWRWRLMGGADATEAHRQWWSDIVAGAAYRAEGRVTGEARRFGGRGPPQ